MRIEMNRRIFGVWFATVLLGFFMVSEAAAGGRRGANNARGDRGQLAVIEQVDAANRTLTTGGTTYFVPQNADLEDESGTRISLSDIHGVGSNTSADLVEIWTRQNGRDGRPEINRLRVKPAMSF